MKLALTGLAIFSTTFSLFMLFNYFHLDYSRIPDNEKIIVNFICGFGCFMLVAQSFFIWILAFKWLPA